MPFVPIMPFIKGLPFGFALLIVPSDVTLLMVSAADVYAGARDMGVGAA
jgi:hypothetical protein